jgi:hypothetical protein
VTILAADLPLEDVPAGTLADEQREDAEPARRRYDPLAASIDHILPRSRGGTDDDGNLQITHLRCNLLKHDQAQPPPEYARARLSLTLDGTPVPFGVWQRAVPRPGAALPHGEFADFLRSGWSSEGR